MKFRIFTSPTSYKRRLPVFISVQNLKKILSATERNLTRQYELFKTNLMSTKVLFGKFLTFSVIMGLMFTLGTSCRKNEVVYTPVNPGPVPPTPAPPAFSDPKLKLMSDEEIANQRSFPGHILYKFGSGLAGGEGEGGGDILDPFKEVGGLIWEVYDYEHTESEFSQIDDKLTALSTQVSELDSTLYQMGNQLNIIESEIAILTADLTTGQFLVPFSDITTAMDSGTYNGLIYYSKVGKKYQSDSTNPVNIANMNLAKSKAPVFANNIYNQSGSAMISDIDEIKKTLVDYQSLRNYVAALIPYCKGQITNSTHAMQAYLMVESYFLTAVNYQFQAATAMVNAANFLDSTAVPAGLAQQFLDADFTPYIKDEIPEFLSSVDFLVANLSEYRDTVRFKKDMASSQVGLVQDSLFYHSLARAQFLSNLLYESVGVTPPVISGHIMIPGKYAPNGGSSPTSISVTIGSGTISANISSFQSILPYPCWNSENNCTPDNSWNTYRFVSPDTVWANITQPVSVVDHGTTATPWVHYAPITGNVTPLWYNPENPSQTSTAKNTSCTMQFGYFSANWQWGYLFLTNSPLSGNGWTTTSATGPFYFRPYNKGLSNSGTADQAFVPFAGTSNDFDNLTFVTNNGTAQKGNPISFSSPLQTAGSMTASGTTTPTKHFQVIVSNHCTNITVSKGSVINPGPVQAWASYSVFYGMGNSSEVDLTVNIGTSLISDGIEMYCVGGDVVSTNWHDMMGQTNKGFGWNQNLTGTTYKPGVQYYYQTADLNSAVPVNITLNTNYQIVYMGDFPLAKIQP
jgi:hypothetical protein